MKEYICKIASIEEMNDKWNYEILNNKNSINWLTWKQEAIDRVKNGKSIAFYGVLNGKVIAEATAVLDINEVQNGDGLVDRKTAYLCAFRTVKRFQGKGYFSQLFSFMIEILKNRGYEKATLGVEPEDKTNLSIYKKYGFTEYIKSSSEKYPDGTEIIVDYYGMKL